LASGDERDQKPERERCLYRGCRWPERLPVAINAVYPETSVQTCIVHMIRHSLNYVPWNDRKAVEADLKSIYRADNPANAALKTFILT